MSESTSRVDILIPAYNGQAFLRPTLESIVAQTYPNKRVLLSNDCSKDATLAIAREYSDRGLEVISQPSQSGGIFQHINRLIPNISAPYAAFFHTDDVYHPEIVAREVAFLEAHPECDAVLTSGIAIDARGEKLWDIHPPRELASEVLDSRAVFSDLLQRGNSFLICPSAMFRSSVFERLGPFRTDLPNAGDLEMWLRIMFAGRIGLIHSPGEPLIRYRYSVGQMSQAYQKQRSGESDFFKAMDAYRDRVELTDEEQAAYSVLRTLDQIHLGLSQLAFAGSGEMLSRGLQSYRAQNTQATQSNLGFVDKLKIKGARLLLPFAGTPVGPPLARFWLKQTDLQRGGVLRLALKAKRWISAQRA